MPTTESPLGRALAYPQQYSPHLLFAIARAQQRSNLGAMADQVCRGADIWNLYEVSWLGEDRRPQMALIELRIPAHSPYLVESKSVKLYLAGLHQQVFAQTSELIALLIQDLSAVVQAPIELNLYPWQAQAQAQAQSASPFAIATLPGQCIDDAPVAKIAPAPDAQCLGADLGQPVAQQLYSHLFKSNCPVTGQPDWASIWIDYQGPALNPSALLSYFLAYRQHPGYHEHCVEQIFAHILQHCGCDRLTVYARFTRRGGIDINPYRSTEPVVLPNWRLLRQ